MRRATGVFLGGFASAAIAASCAISHEPIAYEEPPAAPLFTPPPDEGGVGDPDVACAACPAFSFCEDGRCRCPVDHSAVCGGACVDLMNDDANCGACGHACEPPSDGGGPTCRAGICRTAETFLVPGVNDLGLMTGGAALFADDRAIYVFGPVQFAPGVNGYAVARAEKAPQLNFTTLVSVAQPNGSYFVASDPVITSSLACLAGDELFFAARLDAYSSNAELFHASKTGGAVSRKSIGTFAQSLAASATHVYVATQTSVLRMALPDGPLEPYLDVGATHLAVRGNDLYLAEYLGYAPIKPVRIVHVDLATGARTAIGSTTLVTSLAPLADGLLWTSGMFVWETGDYGERKLLRWTKEPSRVTVLHQNAYAPITGVASDGKNAYYTNGFYSQFDAHSHSVSMIGLGVDDSLDVSLATALVPTTAVTPVLTTSPLIQRMRSPLVDGAFLYWLDDFPAPQLGGVRVRRIRIQ